jgi:hypothetical protein
LRAMRRSNRQKPLLGFSLVLIMSPYSVPIAAELSDFSAARLLEWGS